MSEFRLNQFSSIETSKHVAPSTEYEILEWPRPILTPPLKHAGVSLNTNKRALKPILMGEYENFHQAKGKFDRWISLLDVSQEN